MAVDLDALIRLLEQEPEQRRALRRAIFGDEPDLAAALATLTQRVDALAEAQRRTEQQVAGLAEAQRRTEARLDALIEEVRELAAAQRRTDTRLDSLAEEVRELAKEVRELSSAQLRTENSLSSLIDVVKGMNDRVGKLDGYELERRYREKGHAYLSRIARRLQSLDTNTLSPLLDEAEKTGRASPDEVDSILLVDAIFTGRRRSDGVPVHLVIEASVTIARYDVSRARERADLLARVLGTDVVAVVAGEMVSAPVLEAARDAGVWCVTNGQTVSPEADREEG
ncbi:MAG: hypothetical protein ACR2G7_03520 [Acidimicrobiales bacterium]